MLYNQDWDQNSIPSVLRRAADIIDQRGLGKETLMNRDGSPCAIGAIMLAFDMDERYVRSRGWAYANDMGISSKLYEVIDTVTVGSVASLSHHLASSATLLAMWNNQPSRTKEEVIAKFREVADALVSA